MTTATDITLGITTAAYPGAEPRMLGTDVREDVEAYLARGGYAPLRDPEALLAEVERAGLRGRGGAAFPFARKARAVRAGEAAPVLVANGEEGEPASVKDRWLMRTRPHLVLDGVRLAAALVGAQDVYLYVSDPASAASLADALSAFPAEGWNEISIRVHRVEPSYVAGEETAAVRSIEGGPALPQDKPPRPFEAGVGGRPTLVSNVETLANLPVVHRLGADAYRALGTEDSPGTFLMTLSGTAHDGLYEVPFGVTLADVLRWLGDDPARVSGALVGGYFAGVMNDRVLDLPLAYGAFAEAGSGLGCGALAVVGDDGCPVAVAAAVMDYFARENAGQCGSCFNGTAAMAGALDALRDHTAEEADLDRLRRWATDLRGRGACGTLDGATNVAASLLREFPARVADHLAGRCDACPDATPGKVPFAVATEPKEDLP
ncbi:NADH-ubiquinone oxidoreductase-F iron-sulfur binding region domain-containing protein [Actinocorallia sp. A-T 12471]|uniref:NADH-ubiquinone oxidoreductase-F iron-sulfur binding region domain-containing protein n=1 Tax=Actinocorallia sp. A-T 12471 TaxID=3089813 RepID=UPI0029D385FD|nr:NADH-ubiquinone oxidoreductase-F iron-sulfur binding region domain-containing protein [Actinocorallia sp. A-T 12471]MDX6740172.1 NADH-ubiquinone oxidoreductase-F iron-sulfur binding region domain-containing protein [Actinocorallia sp. A-T 12471]